MGKPIESVALVANTLEATRWIYTSVVARSLKKALVDICNQAKIHLKGNLHRIEIKHKLISCSKAQYSVWKNSIKAIFLITGRTLFSTFLKYFILNNCIKDRELSVSLNEMYSFRVECYTLSLR